ncbi:hypothetical protein [Sorangium sp. So ce363]|uniref:hypothetical protein n=1 Tax=Sorangium sp. So ce363 TaxID=3133304 RepID=UPI003F5F5315
MAFVAVNDGHELRTSRKDRVPFALSLRRALFGISVPQGLAEEEVDDVLCLPLPANDRHVARVREAADLPLLHCVNDDDGTLVVLGE